MEVEGENMAMVQERKTLGTATVSFHGRKDGPLFSWPWENLGNYKYLFYIALVAKYLYTREETKESNWCFHILLLCDLRASIYQFWTMHNMMLFRNRKHRISQEGIDYKQIDAQWHWDNFLILEAILGLLAYFSFPSSLNKLPFWDSKGIICCLALHVGISEPLYYCLHRLLHSPHFFSNYHWLHHSSRVPNPHAAGHASFLEHLLLGVVVGIPTLGTALLGYGSIILMYSYILLFDYLRCLGHSNVEVVPHRLFEIIPFLKYLIYTPTYHSIHHKDKHTNFCLFMPLYDILGKTININSWNLHKKFSLGIKERVPDFVFLAHVVDMMSSMHSPFAFLSFNSIPFSTKFFLFPLWPMSFLSMLGLWVKSKTFLFTFYHLRGQLHQTWIVPRYGFQYFLPFAAEGINKLIEESILRADRIGVKVISLAALNKNEALNGGGTLFVNKHPNLRVRVVHGNTLTAAVILNEIPRDVNEVFLTGATSKLGRAIALYLARKKVRIMMLTQSTERFVQIQKEAPKDCQEYLVQVTKYQAAQHCKTWIVGKWTTPREQSWAPKGTHFHQFVVPPIIPFRRDCTYGKLAAMRLPDDVDGLGSCEYTMDRGIVHACHAGGVVHFLEGWEHHEVGAIAVDQIDVVWEAALRHGLKVV